MPTVFMHRIAYESFTTHQEGSVASIPSINPYWRRVTHLVYECLEMVEGFVRIYESPRFLNSPNTFIGELKKLKTHHAHLKVILSFYRPFRVNAADSLSAPDFFEKLKALVVKSGFDGAEIDFNGTWSNNFPAFMTGVDTCCKNGNEILFRVNPTLDFTLTSCYNSNVVCSYLRLLCKISGFYIVVNTSGYHNKVVFATDTTYLSQIIAGDQCGVENVAHVLQTLVTDNGIPGYHVILNFPTRAISYEAADVGGVAHSISEVARRDFNHLMPTDPNAAFLIVAPGLNSQLSKIISFDSRYNQLKKLKLVDTYNLKGIVLDDLAHDFAWNDVRSLFQIAYDTLKSLERFT